MQSEGPRTAGRQPWSTPRSYHSPMVTRPSQSASLAHAGTSPRTPARSNPQRAVRRRSRRSRHRRAPGSSPSAGGAAACSRSTRSQRFGPDEPFFTPGVAATASVRRGWRAPTRRAAAPVAGGDRVDAGEEVLAPAQERGRDHEVQLVDEAGREVLADGGDSPAQPDVLAPRRLRRALQRGVDTVGDEVERRAPVDGEGRPRVVSGAPGPCCAAARERRGGLARSSLLAGVRWAGAPRRRARPVPASQPPRPPNRSRSSRCRIFPVAVRGISSSSMKRMVRGHL